MGEIAIPKAGAWNVVKQGIHGLTVVPEAGAITITFTTTRPSKPVFTVWRRIANVAAQDMVPANQVAFSGETTTPQTTHTARITALPQGLPLWLRVDAAAEDVPAGDLRRPASLFCPTGTFVRVCLAKILSVEVLNSGDSGGGASMLFQFQVYNGMSSEGEALIPTKQADVDSVDNGGLVGGMVGEFKIDAAPDTVVPYLEALHWKGSFPGLPLKGRQIGDTLPSDTGSGSDDDAEWADCLARAALPTGLGSTTSGALVLSTGLLVPSVEARLVFETIVSNPSGISTFTPPRLPPGGFVIGS
jgi:hypothetical protein